MKKFAMTLTLVVMLLLAMPLAFAQGQGRGRTPANVASFNQVLEQLAEGGDAAQVAAGLINVQVIAQNVNVAALNNIAVNVQLTDVLRDFNILTDFQVVVNVLSAGGQFFVRVLETVEQVF